MNNIDVLRNILLVNDVKKSILNNENIIFEIIPILKYEKGFEQRSRWHWYDVWNHTINAVSASDKDFEIRLVLLLHDIGKPFSYQDDKDIRHFKGHALKSKEISKNILEDLGYKGEMLEELLFLIGEHASKINDLDINSDNIDLYNKLLDVKLCDASAYEPIHARKMILSLNDKKEELRGKCKKIVLENNYY